MQVESDYIKQEAKKQCYWMKDGVFNIVAWTEAMMQLSADRAGSKIRQLEIALREINACTPYLKTGETPADALLRLTKELDAERALTVKDSA